MINECKRQVYIIVIVNKGIEQKGITEGYHLVKIMFTRRVSVRMYKGNWGFGMYLSLCGATSAHTSELYFLQAHHAIDRVGRNTNCTGL